MSTSIDENSSNHLIAGSPDHTLHLQPDLLAAKVRSVAGREKKMTRAARTDRNAEDDVARLCRGAGASVQRVSEDDNGYDLMVEFPSQVQTAFPDIDPPLTRCLVQVKSVKSRRPATRMKVSNALKLAKDSLPCFIALVTYPCRPDRHEAIYLRHIWTREMAEALETARRCAARNQPLNRQHLSISFTPNERVDDALADHLLSAVAREGANYGDRKRQMAGSLGYENGWGESRFVLADGHDEGDLQDLLLGSRKELPFQSCTITESRFGIPGPQQTNGPGILSVTVEPRARCVVNLTRRRTGEQLSWTGSVFSAGMNWLPIEQQKFRIAAGPLEMLITRGGNVTASWKANPDAPRSLDDLERDARFRSMMDGSTIDIDIWSERGTMPANDIKFDSSEDPEGWVEILEAIQTFSRIIPPERRPEEMKLSMSAFLRHLPHHKHLTALLQPAQTSMRVVNKNGLEPTLQSATHIVFPWVSRLGDFYVVSVIEREINSAFSEKNMVTFNTENGRILRGTTMHVSGATDALVANEVEWARQRAEASDRKVLSYHPDGDNSGSLILSTPD